MLVIEFPSDFDPAKVSRFRYAILDISYLSGAILNGITGSNGPQLANPWSLSLRFGNRSEPSQLSSTKRTFKRRELCSSILMKPPDTTRRYPSHLLQFIGSKYLSTLSALRFVTEDASHGEFFVNCCIIKLLTFSINIYTKDKEIGIE